MGQAVLVCGLLGATACELGSPTAPSPVDRQVVLAIGQSAPITAAALSLTFLGVPTDSRCPANALCIDAGSASVDVLATAFSGGASVLRFETRDPKPVRLGSTTVALVQLSPYPASSRPIAPADYRATLRVRR